MTIYCTEDIKLLNANIFEHNTYDIPHKVNIRRYWHIWREKEEVESYFPLPPEDGHLVIDWICEH